MKPTHPVHTRPTGCPAKRDSPLALGFLRLVAAFLAMGACAARALPPRAEYSQPVGVDARGREWFADFAHDKPVVVRGPDTHTLRGSFPYDSGGAITFLEAGTHAWILKGDGRGFRVRLADGNEDDARLPVEGTLGWELACASNSVFYADTDKAGLVHVREWRFANTKPETRLTGKAGWSLLGIRAAPDRVWVALWDGYGAREQGLEITAWEPLTGKRLAETRLHTPWAPRRWTDFTLVPGLKGELWIADGMAGAVRRITADGSSETWSTGKLRPIRLVVCRFGAVCVGQEMEDPDAQPSVPFFQQPGVLRQELLAFAPGQKDPARLERPVGEPLVPAADAQGNLSLTTGLKVVWENGILSLSP